MEICSENVSEKSATEKMHGKNERINRKTLNWQRTLASCPRATNARNSTNAIKSLASDFVECVKRCNHFGFGGRRCVSFLSPNLSFHADGIRDEVEFVVFGWKSGKERKTKRDLCDAPAPPTYSHSNSNNSVIASVYKYWRTRTIEKRYERHTNGMPTKCTTKEKNALRTLIATVRTLLALPVHRNLSFFCNSLKTTACGPQKLRSV